MRIVRTTAQFRKSLKKLLRSGRFDRTKLQRTIELLTAGEKLPPSYEDHSLVGDLADTRECHLGFDLLLIYRVENNNLVLVLINLGSHDDLFG